MLFRTTVLAAATSLFTIARAQYEIDPESVPLALRENWCLNAMESCPIICSQYDPPTTLVNDCDSETLLYGCLCGDNRKPNISEYSLTIPYFTCREWGNQCVTDCGNNAACASSCREDHPCGAQDPERVNTTSTGTSTMKPTASVSETDDGTTIYTNPPGGADSSNSDDEGAAATLLTMGSRFGLSVIMGGMFLGFALF